MIKSSEMIKSSSPRCDVPAMCTGGRPSGDDESSSDDESDDESSCDEGWLNPTWAHACADLTYQKFVEAFTPAVNGADPSLIELAGVLPCRRAANVTLPPLEPSAHCVCLWVCVCRHAMGTPMGVTSFLMKVVLPCLAPRAC